MYTDQCISVTDLRRKTGQFIGNKKYEEQFIFVGSKPTNALLTMERYQELKRIEDLQYERDLDFSFAPYRDLSKEEKARYDQSKKEDISSYINY